MTKNSAIKIKKLGVLLAFVLGAQQPSFAARVSGSSTPATNSGCWSCAIPGLRSTVDWATSCPASAIGSALSSSTTANVWEEYFGTNAKCAALLEEESAGTFTGFMRVEKTTGDFCVGVTDSPSNPALCNQYSGLITNASPWSQNGKRVTRSRTNRTHYEISYCEAAEGPNTVAAKRYVYFVPAGQQNFSNGQFIDFRTQQLIGLDVAPSRAWSATVSRQSIYIVSDDGLFKAPLNPFKQYIENPLTALPPTWEIVSTPNLNGPGMNHTRVPFSIRASNATDPSRIFLGADGLLVAPEQLNGNLDWEVWEVQHGISSNYVTGLFLYDPLFLFIHTARGLGIVNYPFENFTGPTIGTPAPNLTNFTTLNGLANSIVNDSVAFNYNNTFKLFVGHSKNNLGAGPGSDAVFSASDFNQTTGRFESFSGRTLKNQQTGLDEMIGAVHSLEKVTRPNGNDWLVAGTTDGLWISQDGGALFTRMTGIPASRNVYEITQSGNTLWIGTHGVPTGPSAVAGLYSIDVSPNISFSSLVAVQQSFANNLPGYTSTPITGGPRVVEIQNLTDPNTGLEIGTIFLLRY